jgi:hypothetical protein
MEYGLNRHAWHLLFQLARYHPSTLDLIKSKQFEQFVELLHPRPTGGMFVNANGLFYFAKLLALVVRFLFFAFFLIFEITYCCSVVLFFCLYVFFWGGVEKISS